ncbi:hypothetical protein Desaci_2085 [Desulfosporosinus acidiphilus SJ4]|uniref:Lipoprotein n=1 Tax=Desulfosporosinus acidiphilus (strain DSM 22704 / JCM 16185 / SJ4) TaxID=646529 RepID=I4D5I2_DESAJ|nr:hypothetical protein [Desulfosporosinus acidiphilus]AFM41056.1 hypothetical protein Desaci_2085 [Desulfosporosinus acidiphilus SJ4]
MTRKSLLAVILISIFLIATGCGKESVSVGGTNVVSANKINPIEKGKIGVVEIHKGFDVKKLTDTNIISTMIDCLMNVNVKKLGRDEDRKVLDGGNALKKASTITIYFFPDNNSKMKSMAILLSERQLYLPDVKSMQSNSYTVSYLNDNDETSLKSIQTLYSIAEDVMKK